MGMMITTMDQDAEFPEFDADKVIKAKSLAMIFGGTNNTTLYMAMTLAALLSNPDVLKKVQDELEIHVGKNRVVEYSDIENLTYLQAVIKEVFCLYPSAQLNVPHEATEECQIQGFNVQIQGFTREYDEHRSRSRRIQCTRYKYSIME